MTIPSSLGALHRMYTDEVPRRYTGRATSSADVERNAQPSALARTDLSWRALLCARAELPAARAVRAASPRCSRIKASPSSGAMKAARYVALDYGHSGGGHGHPDRLNLLLAANGQRWLDDMGTGSYVDPSLHWYRSTLAHNAPLLDGRSQRPVDGVLTAYDERNDVGWIEAVADDLTPGTTVGRTLIVMPSYAVDFVEWHADRDVLVDLPLHVDAAIVSDVADAEALPLVGGAGVEDGFDSLRDATRQLVAAGAVVHAVAGGDDARLDLWSRSSPLTEWWRATGLGAPGQGEHAFRVLRCRAASGTHQLVWSWGGDVTAVDFGDAIRVTLRDGTAHDHWRADDGWRIAGVASAGGAVVRLGGRVEPEDELVPGSFTQRASDPRQLPLRLDIEERIELGEAHYRRSEESWSAAGAPTASVGLRWRGQLLEVRVLVPRSDLTFVPPGALNLYDNEAADINGDSVQLYVRAGSAAHAVMLVPIADSEEVRLRAIDGWELPHDAVSTWAREGNGYELRVALPSMARPVALDVIVNEMPKGRTRRRGQLVLSGGAGEWVYLRGDRHDALRLIPIMIADE